MSVIDDDEFSAFTKSLKIDSKEKGILSLGDNMLGSQKRLYEQLQLGMQEGVREFVTLKCRQIGISTYTLALDLYWINKYPGVSGALVTHDDRARDQFRTTLQLYRSGLDEEWQREVVDDNRNQLVLENGSRLAMRVAGTTQRKGGSTLGRSGALIFAHCTEAAFYGDPDSIHSLRSSFAEQNPIRFFHWESTANGFNHYHQMWQDAKKSTTSRAIFISWWSNEFYRAPQGSPVFETYWGKSGRLTKTERTWIKDVKLLYGYDIDAEQVAWYRWKGSEDITDENMLNQEFPTTEEMAFIASGSAFFRTLPITEAIKKINAQEDPSTYRVETGTSFVETRVSQCNPKKATLTVWAEPEPGAYYSIGCDPAYASSEFADFSAISVWRCWYNRIEQVAEFASRETPTHAVAWILAYLAGYYGNASVNIEVNGPGISVLAELNNLKRAAHSKFEGDKPEAIKQVVRYMRQYIYRRIDTRSAASSLLHTKTTEEVKERMMNGFRDYFERDMAILRSRKLVEEMKNVVREGGSAPGAPSGRNDDRVISAALALMCWNDQMRVKLLGEGVIWRDIVVKQQTDPTNQAERMVQNYFRSIGIIPELDGVPPPKKTVAVGRPRWSVARSGGTVSVRKE